MAHSKKTKPRYVNAAGSAGAKDLPSVPPFLFREVTCRVFPLKANMARLTDFCDKYVNMDIPQNIAKFRPAIPYVYMMVINYGSMSPASVRAQNVGWVAQHEVTFTVPLEWWREENGRMAFKDWACVSPFIFVDDDISLTTGREIYGWPKVKASIDTLNAPLWVEDPRSPTRMFTLQAPLLPKLYAGVREEPRDLVLIDRAPPPSLAMFPPDLKNPLSPLGLVPNALKAWLGLAGDAAEMLTQFPMLGYRLPEDHYAPRRGLRNYAAMGKLAAGNMIRMMPDLLWQGPVRKLVRQGQPERSEDAKYAENFLNTVTIKQFRDAEDPSRACYQALVNSRMGYNRLNGCGLLGDYAFMLGDPTGGYTIRIAQYDAQPIVESLGLEVDTLETGRDAPVAVLKPTFPFWTDLDLYYGKGEVVCSRTPCMHSDGACNDWRAEGATDREPPAGADHCGTDKADPHAEPEPIFYNTITGAATQPIAGPFHFPDATVQVYPLLADPEKLADFLRNYLNEPLAETGRRYEPFGGYVYLLVNVFGDDRDNGRMWSEANNIGWWADRSVQFLVPAKCYRGGELEGIVLVSPFVFGNSGRAVISDREVNGRPTVKASIEAHPDAWLDEAGPVAARRMLRLDTEAFPAQNLGQKAMVRTLLEIDQRPPVEAEDRTGWRFVAERWREPLVADLMRKAAFATEHAEELGDVRALALELLAHDAPLHWLHLKQYRDAADSGLACYQALIRTTRTIKRLYEIREIEAPVYVRLHQMPDHPIAEVLGLKAMHVVSDGDGPVRVFQPVRPFWVRVGFKEELGKILHWRTEDGPWQASRHAGKPMAPHAARVGAGLLGEMEKNNQGIRETARRWLHDALVREAAALQPQLQAKAEELREAWGKPSDKNDDPAARSLALAIVAAATESPASSGQAAEARFRALLATVSTAAAYAAFELIRGELPEPTVEAELARLSMDRGRQAIEHMPDLQVAIETILSSAWENPARPRPSGGGDDGAASPEPGSDRPFRIPAGSFPKYAWNDREEMKYGGFSLAREGAWLFPISDASAVAEPRPRAGKRQGSGG
jgi:hypothetical protein